MRWTSSQEDEEEGWQNWLTLLIDWNQLQGLWQEAAISKIVCHFIS
jgi:hypothetical protein